MRKAAIVLLLAVATGPGDGLHAGPRDVQTVPRDVEWAMHGGVDNIRYSPLRQIDRTNVANLKVAWTYDSHDAFMGCEMQSNPGVVGGVLYATRPTQTGIALKGETGQ